MVNDRRPVRHGKPYGKPHRNPHSNPVPVREYPPSSPPGPATGTGQGVLELHPKGFGFLRSPTTHYAARPNDAYVPAPVVQRFGLREGLLVAGPTEAARQGTGPRLLGVEEIEGRPPNQFPRRNFDELTPIDPTSQ